MGYSLVMHLRKTVENLLRETLYLLHGHGLLLLFSVAQFVLEAAVTELHDGVLDQLVLCTHRVKEVHQLNDVGTSFEHAEDLILS